jgi:hypothetical protein
VSNANEGAVVKQCAGSLKTIAPARPSGAVDQFVLLNSLDLLNEICCAICEKSSCRGPILTEENVRKCLILMFDGHDPLF